MREPSPYGILWTHCFPFLGRIHHSDWNAFLLGRKEKKTGMIVKRNAENQASLRNWKYNYITIMQKRHWYVNITGNQIKQRWKPTENQSLLLTLYIHHKALPEGGAPPPRLPPWEVKQHCWGNKAESGIDNAYVCEYLCVCAWLGGFGCSLAGLNHFPARFKESQYLAPSCAQTKYV